MALVEFHEGRYTIPDHYVTLAHQVLAADNLGENIFLDYICNTLKVPKGRINSSNRYLDVKMALRDKMTLKNIVRDLRESTHCFVCKNDLGDATALSGCCNRVFHYTCILDCMSCPYCWEPWGRLPCFVCKKPTVSKNDRELFRSYTRRQQLQMKCFGVDIHMKCRRFVHVCPSCGETKFSSKDFRTYLMLRRERRRNNARRRLHTKSHFCRAAKIIFKKS